MQARLDRVYGPRDDIDFSGNMRPVNVLIEATGSDDIPIQTSISVGHVVDLNPSSLYKLNVSHLDSPDFRALVHRVWNLVPRPIGDRGWLLWWEVAIRRTVKFMRGWGHMIARKRRRELREARRKLEEVHIFLEEDLHNTVLQEDAARLELVVRREEESIARGARVRARLQWIQEGDEGSKFFFSFLKKKVVADRVLGLCRVDGSLEEDPTKIQGMFGDHFQNMFFSLPLVRFSCGC